MKAFWPYVLRALRYRSLLTVALAAALLDAACAFGGFGTLLWVLGGIFSQDTTVRQMLEAELLPPPGEEATGLAAWVDPRPVIELVPADAFWGFAAVLGVILGFTLVGSVLRFVYQSAVITVVLRTVMTVRKDAYHRLVHAPMDLVTAGGSSDYLSRIVRDSSQLNRGLSAVMGRAVRDVLMGLAMLLLALVFNWRLTLIFLVGMALVFVCIRKLGKRVRKATRRALVAYGVMVGVIQESMQGLAVVKTHQAEGYERRRFNAVNRRVLAQELRSRTAKALSSPLIEVIAITGIITVSLVAAWTVFRLGRGDAADMGRVLGALAMAGVSLRPLANLNNNLQEAAAAAGRVDGLLSIPVESSVRARGAPAAPAAPRHRQAVRFESVSYTYPGADRPAVDAVNLEALFGQSVAIVGTNGSGKSTLLSLLPRLLEPTGGRILIDGVDIAGVSLRSLRRQIAVVTQRTIMFGGTIADNIAYGRRHTARDRIEAAARAAHADAFIRALPEGYDTVLAEGGEGLSGGQRQRLCIARAILRNPAIMILDEATSQVDSESEQKINAALTELKRGRTTFIIAHRLSTVIDADCIAVLKDGALVAQGRHEELLETSGVYRALAQTQLIPAGA